MRKYCITIILVLFCLIELRAALGAENLEPPIFNVIFSEVLLGSVTSGSEEFIELHNTTDSNIDLTEWKVEYFSSATTDPTKPTRTVVLSGELAAHNYLLLSSTAYRTELTSIKYSATLSQAGGSLRLIHQADGVTSVEDAMAWGGGKMGLGDPIIPPEAGQSLVRLQNEEDEYEPGLNNIDDFKTTPTATPLTDNTMPEPEISPGPAEEPVPEETTPISETEQTTEPRIFHTLEISEIFPNPAEPQSDAEDEFIELFNPHAFAVEISGYTLKAGLNGTYKHTFSEGLFIEAGEYMSVTSKDTNLTLSNTAGKVVLLSPDAAVLSESAEYSDAKEGQSYILTTEGWKWTATPTMAAVNIYNAPPPPAVKSKAKKATAAKSKKTKAAKKTALKAKTASNKANGQRQSAPLEELSGPVHPLVLAGAGALTVVYTGYEYRGDFRNFVQKFRRNGIYRTTAVKKP